MSAKNSSEYVGTSKAAEILGLTPARVKQLAGQGRIGQLILGRYHFTREELRAFGRVKRPGGRPKNNPKKSA